MVLITSDFASHKAALEANINSKTISEFVISMKDEYPNLVDYMGITEATIDIEFDGQASIFADHLPIEEMSKLVKQGDLFQGKIRIDRNDINEGSVFIPKYDFEIRLTGSSSLNRALNGDTVAIRLHPESSRMIRFIFYIYSNWVIELLIDLIF